MSIFLLVLGLVFILIGILFFLKSLRFYLNSNVIEGMITDKRLVESDESYTIQFYFENEDYEYHYKGMNSLVIGDKINLRIHKQKKSLKFTLNNILSIFGDSLVLLPIGLSLFLISFLFK